jgi:hypothetical protein
MSNTCWPPIPEINRTAWKVVFIELGPLHTIDLYPAGTDTLTRLSSTELKRIRLLRSVAGCTKELVASEKAAFAEQRRVEEKKIADRSAMLQKGASLYQEIADLPDKTIQARLEDHRTAARLERLQHFKARFDFWARMDDWTIDEGLYLAFGIDPDSLGKTIPPNLTQDLKADDAVIRSILSSIVESWEKSIIQFSLSLVLPQEEIAKYEQAKTIALRKFGLKNQQGTISMGTKRYSPKGILNWFTEKEIPLHAELVEALEERGIFLDDLQKLTDKLSATDKLVDKLTRENENLDAKISELEAELATHRSLDADESIVKCNAEKPLHHKKERTYLFLLGALLKKQGIDWTTRGAAQRLVELVQQLGESIDSDTVRTRLNDLSSDDQIKQVILELRNKVDSNNNPETKLTRPKT